MISKTDIIKMAKHVIKRGQGIPDRRLLHPRREWIVIVFCSVVVLLGGGISGAIQFLSLADVATGEMSVEDVPVVRYNQNTVASALATYAERAERFSSIGGSPAPIPESPSTTTTTSTPAEIEAATTTTPTAATTTSASNSIAPIEEAALIATSSEPAPIRLIE